MFADSELIKVNRSLAKVLYENKKMALTTFLIIFGFSTVYCIMSIMLAKTGIFYKFDILFEIDTPRVISDITSFSGDHYRTKVHPIYVLLVNPIGSFLSLIYPKKIAVAILINAFLGSLGVGMSFMFFWLFSRNYVNSILLAITFGFSMSQFFLSITPDTATFAVCSLIINYTLLLNGIQKKQLFIKLWIVAGILSLGITTTNFAQSLICFISLAYFLNYKDGKLNFHALYQILIFTIGTVCFTCVLSIFQKLIYPSSNLFFLPSAYSEELLYSSLLILKQPLLIISQLLKHFFVVNFISPLPKVFNMHNTTYPWITFASSWNYQPIGWIGVVLWIGLLLNGFIQSFIHSKIRIFFFGMLLCVLFNMVLHSIYGVGEKGKIEYFLYTGNFTFCVLTFFSYYSIKTNNLLRIILISLMTLIGVNNFIIILHILHIYKHNF